MHSSFYKFRRKLEQHGLVPETLVGWTALYSGALWVVLYLLRRATGAVQGPLDTSFSFTTLVVAGSLMILGYRWSKQKFMWRLRNRLIVTYIFIGVIPLVLVATMALLAGYLFAGQFSSFVVSSDLQAELKRISALNYDTAAQLEARLRKPGAPSISELIDTDQGHRQVVAYYRGKSMLLQKGDAEVIPTLPKEFPAQEAGKTGPKNTSELNAIVLDDDKVFLRSATTFLTGPRGDEELIVISSVPLTNTRLEQISSSMGAVKLYGRSQQGERLSSKGVMLKVGDTFLDPTPKVSAGHVPPATSRFDVEFLPPGALVAAYDWEAGKPTTMLMMVQTRPSMFYQRLFRTVGEMSNIILVVLVSVGIIFAVIELIALIIGVRLTRTMTRSVSALYDATQHVNRGDFSHRIKVTSQDQLAALETSFNSMTESLEELIAEQKEKQRIESELAIAQEVQALLFPRDITELEDLEVHGICRPARTVSGDYYDFLPVGPTRLGIAVGDIAGKGISAALLMATVHAFVRAYTLMEQVPVAAGVAAQTAREHATVLASRNGWLPPGTLLAMLNQQLYRSTPTEKYATMFLGFYDQVKREFTYSNAGHLPPLIIGADGHIRQLETGGTVVGLFGDMSYPDGSVKMNSGDIFVAYSDGITEPENEFGEFGVERLASLIQENRDLSLARISDIVVAAVADWIGDQEQPDDVTLVLARAR